jgi:hypothetical protein
MNNYEVQIIPSHSRLFYLGFRKRLLVTTENHFAVDQLFGVSEIDKASAASILSKVSIANGRIKDFERFSYLGLSVEPNAILE